MSGPTQFDWSRMLAALTDGHVQFVVIGAVAGRILGSPTLTRDLDIC